MKIVLWIGNEPNQTALACRIAERFGLSAIVTESRKKKGKWKLKQLPGKFIEKLFFGSIGRAWLSMQRYYRDKYPALPDIPRMDVENINSDEVLEFTRSHSPDVILVSGTRLIRKKMFSLNPPLGFMNLHTGLSPYVKGGPNCTNWCISTGDFHMIGNTVMWLDEGIDSGNLIATELTPFTGYENLNEVHIRVMEHAHALYLKALNMLEKGQAGNCPQSSIAEGKTYYTRQWGLLEKLNLLRNFRRFGNEVRSGEIRRRQSEIILIPHEQQNTYNGD